MWLTKNEKRVLKLLIDNAKLSDTSMANKLNISSQAIGRIRKKLEEEIIKNYTIELDVKKLGLNSISLISAHYQQENKKNMEKNLSSCPKIVSAFRLASGTNKCKILKLDFDLEGCENCDLDNCKLLEISEIQVIPISNVIKNNIKPIFHKAIDDLGIKTKNNRFGLVK